MKAENKNKVIKRRGKTQDIIDETMNTYNKYVDDCYEFAQQFIRETERESCKAIFDYVIENINYKEDPVGVQWIKTPARLINDGVGDCKSMSIFVASMLNNIGISCFFRFVGFSENKNITHVYIVTNSGIIIDPVERIDGKPVFDYAQNYTYKIDMNTTTISRLSGTPGDDEIYDIWTNKTWILDNTIAANYLYTELDYLTSLINLSPDNRELYNLRDTIYIALSLYNKSKGYEDLMKRAGCVLELMAENDIFNIDSIDNGVRTHILKEIKYKALDILLDFSYKLPSEGNYIKWWYEKIICNDYNKVSDEGKKIFLEKNAIAIGASSTELNGIIRDMQKSAPYFMYLFLGKKWVNEHKSKYPIIYKKYVIERNLYKTWINNCSNYIDENTIYLNLRSGFMKKTGKTPEEFVNSVIASNEHQVGLAPVLIAAIISGVVAILSAVIVAISDIAKKSMDSPENWPDGTPNDNDLTLADFNTNKNSNTSLANSKYNKWFIFGGIATLIYYFNKKK